MKGSHTMMTGLGLGVGLMYFLDPDRGRRRRALVRDKGAYSVNTAANVIGTTRRDLAHRAAGAVARVRGLFRRHPVDDDVLIERVRAQLGRAVSHPHAVHVDAFEGCVTLNGPVLEHEERRLLRAVRRVRGVCDVVNALDPHAEPGSVPSLQGGSPRRSRPSIWRGQWAPTTRFVVGTAGTALAGYGAARKDVPGALFAATGVGLIARAATDEVKREPVNETAFVGCETTGPVRYGAPHPLSDP